MIDRDDRQDHQARPKSGVGRRRQHYFVIEVWDVCRMCGICSSDVNFLVHLVALAF